MEVAKVTSKGQITIPISIRRKLEINEGDKILFIYKPEGVMMVNPNNMQGGASGDVVEAAETETAAEAIAAMKQRETTKQVQPTAPPVAAAQTIQAPEPAPQQIQSYEPDEPEEPEIPEPQPVVRRPVPPPVEEPEPPQDKHIGGFNLSTLLDDIRSIGSNI